MIKPGSNQKPVLTPAAPKGAPAAKSVFRQTAKVPTQLLVNLNMDLSYRNYRSFSPAHFRYGQNTNPLPTTRSWTRNNRGKYKNETARTLAEVLDCVVAVKKEFGEKWREKIAFAYNGRVYSPWGFCIGDDKKALGRLYNRIVTHQEGRIFAVKNGKRDVGFPSIIRLKPTKTMKEEHGVRGIKGDFNAKAFDGNPMYIHVTFPPGTQKTDEYQELCEKILKSPHGAYFIGTPYIRLEQNEHYTLKSLCFRVNNVLKHTHIPDSKSEARKYELPKTQGLLFSEATPT